ncbi:Replication factor C (RF-C) subunit [Perkinsus chesapeaki]|uniref:Replication factor C (RF-C) subunit n=1 Tax=Perkinsus chesapeaki TaxID=330153 RepID=A0A7J6LDN2_PERCH|nr:Replication factor C (RF-C) subunit [Perkinsus chesapeaki]
MPRRSSSRNTSAPRRSAGVPRTSPNVLGPAQQVQQRPRGGIISDLVGTMASSMASGVGFTFANRIVEAIIGPRRAEVIHKHEKVAPSQVCILQKNDLEKCLEESSSAEQCHVNQREFEISIMSQQPMDLDDIEGATATVLLPPTNELPWVEKYRPKNLDDLVAHQQIISTIKRFVNMNALPHLLLHGPPGTGKTSTILACAKQMYPNGQLRQYVLELNASDARGIDVVRECIKQFVSSRSMFSGALGSKMPKLVILDEADNMTSVSQFALRRVIEQYSSNARFCLICNYASKIIPALQSRCTKFRFPPLKDDEAQKRVEYVAKCENVRISDDGMKALLKTGDGDMRKILNTLQSCSLSYPAQLVDATIIHKVAGLPQPASIDRLESALCQMSVKDGMAVMEELRVKQGYSTADLLREVHERMVRADMPSKARNLLFRDMAEIEYRLASGCSEEVQGATLVGAFHEVREMMTK